MRETLVDQERRNGSLKRGGQSQRVEFTEGVALIQPLAEDLLALDEASGRLRDKEPDLAEIVQLRHDIGLSLEETEKVMGRSLSTVKRKWRRARAWRAGWLGAGATAEAQTDEAIGGK